MLPEGGGAMSMEQVMQTLAELESSHWSSKDPESVIRAKMSQARETISSLQAEVADLRRKLEISGRKRGLSVAQSTALSGFFTGLFRSVSEFIDSDDSDEGAGLVRQYLRTLNAHNVTEPETLHGVLATSTSVVEAIIGAYRSVNEQYAEAVNKNAMMIADFERLAALDSQYADAVNKNTRLIAEYERMKTHAIETDRLCDEQARKVQELEAEVRSNHRDMEQAEVVVNKLTEHNTNLIQRMRFKSVAERYEWSSKVIKKDAERAAAEKKRQGISDDQARGDIGIENDDAKRWEATKKTLSQHYDALHKKKEAYKACYTATRLTCSKLEGVVAGLRETLNERDQRIVELTAKVPRSDSLIYIRSMEDKLRTEAASHADRMRGVVTPGCKNCSALWIAYKDCSDRLFSAETAVKVEQGNMLKRVAEIEAAADARIREGTKDLERLKNERSVEARNAAEAARAQVEREKQMSEKVANLEKQVADVKQASERRTRHKDEEIARIKAEMNERVRDSEELQLGRLCMQFVNSVCRTVVESAQRDPVFTDRPRIEYAGRLLMALDTYNKACAANVSKDKLRPVLKEIENLAFLQTDSGESAFLDLCDGTVRAIFVKNVASSVDDVAVASKRARPIAEGEEGVIGEEDDIFSKLVSMIATETLAVIEAFAQAKWRTRVDIESITKRKTFLRAFSQRLAMRNKGKATEADAKQLLKVLMTPFSSSDETPFFHWMTHNAVACVTTNEHISSAANKTLVEDNEKLSRCNLTLSERFKALLTKMLEETARRSSGPSGSVIYPEDAVTIHSMAKMVDEGFVRVDALNNRGVPEELIDHLGNFKLAWGYVYKIITLLCQGTYARERDR